MEYQQIEVLFQYAADQARAVKTLHTYNCITKPTFKEARKIALTYIREILCGAVPVNDNGTIRMAEDMPSCVEAFRIIIVNSRAYDQHIEALNTLDNTQLSSAIANLEYKAPTHECKSCSPVTEDRDVLSAPEGNQGVGIQGVSPERVTLHGDLLQRA